MKKILLILSAIAVSGTALVIAQEDTRDAPRGGDRRGGRTGGMFANAPFFKALGMTEDGSIKLPKTPEEKEALLAAIAKCDTDGDGKLTRTEIFGERTRGGRGGQRRRPEGGGGAGGGQPTPPASE